VKFNLKIKMQTQLNTISNHQLHGSGISTFPMVQNTQWNQATSIRLSEVRFAEKDYNNKKTGINMC
jgi:hypothetical protein